MDTSVRLSGGKDQQAHRIPVQQREHLAHDVPTVLFVPLSLSDGTLKHLWSVCSSEQAELGLAGRASPQPLAHLDHVGPVRR